MQSILILQNEILLKESNVSNMKILVLFSPGAAFEGIRVETSSPLAGGPNAARAAWCLWFAS
jgi:hypothetical protein